MGSSTSSALLVGVVGELCASSCPETARRSPSEVPSDMPYEGAEEEVGLAELPTENEVITGASGKWTQDVPSSD